MAQTKTGKIVHQDKEGNIHIAVFKNPKYIKNCLTLRTFPFKYNQKIYFSEPEKQRILTLLSRQPAFAIKQPKEKTTKKKKVLK